MTFKEELYQYFKQNKSVKLNYKALEQQFNKPYNTITKTVRRLIVENKIGETVDKNGDTVIFVGNDDTTVLRMVGELLIKNNATVAGTQITQQFYDSLVKALRFKGLH